MSASRELTKFEEDLINGCIKGHRKSQEQLYAHYYGYAMSVCMAYAGDREEAVEILNEGFLKIFTKIDTYKKQNAFTAWLRRTMVNTAIDYFRSNRKYRLQVELTEAIPCEQDFDIIDQLTVEEILGLLQQLPEKYRLSFNLYEIEGYSHQEIGEMLGIPVGTSRSNLARAKQKLRKLLLNTQQGAYNYEKAV